MTAEYKVVRVEIIDCAVTARQHNRFAVRVKIRGFNNFMRKQKSTTVLIAIFMTNWSANMALQSFHTNFDLSYESGIPSSKFIEGCLGRIRWMRWAFNSRFIRRVYVDPIIFWEVVMND